MCVIEYYGNEKEKILTIQKDIEEIIIPDTVKSIGSLSFAHCKKLKKVIIPDSVVEICDFAFDNCINLEEVKMSKNIIQIDDRAFTDCIKLKEIYLPHSIQYIGKNVFAFCNNKLKITYEGTREEFEKIDRYKSAMSFTNLSYAPKTLDALILEGKTFKNVNDFFKNKIDNIIER